MQFGNRCHALLQSSRYLNSLRVHMQEQRCSTLQHCSIMITDEAAGCCCRSHLQSVLDVELSFSVVMPSPNSSRQEVQAVAES
jgi:hypothetical protein